MRAVFSRTGDERGREALGYDLRRRHTAAVLWTDPRRPDQAALAAAAEALGPVTGARQVLTVSASSSSVWAWLAAADTAAALTAATGQHPAVRVAVGATPPSQDPQASTLASSARQARDECDTPPDQPQACTAREATEAATRPLSNPSTDDLRSPGR